jgi:hypothetical protein
MTAQPTAGVARVIAEMVKGKEEMDQPLAKMVAGAIAKNFNVKAEDVSILRLKPNGKQLEFVVPEKLARIGTIPMTSTRALAVRTLRDRKPEFINNFQAAEHHTVFEAVKLTKEGAVPIQKIMSIPILSGGKPAGVIQVTRKGKSPGAAGPDFGAKDCDELTQIATALSSCLAAP